MRAQTPSVGLVLTFVEGRNAVVFGIEEDDVDADGGCLLLQLARYFQQYAYSAGSVVGSYDGRLVLLGVIVFVGIGATVPVGTEQYAPAAVGVVAPMMLRDFSRVPS